MHQLERGWMNRVAAEIAQEVGVFFQDNHLHACARKKEAKHHSGRAAANDDATCLQFLRRFSHE
jgi:hypothetical protein